MLGIVLVEGACFFGFALPCSLQMFLLCLFVLVLGCEFERRSALGGGGKGNESLETREKALTANEAMGMPFVAGFMLFGLYFAFKYLDAKWVNLLLRAYFTAFGAGSLAHAARPLFEAVLPSSPLFTLPLDAIQLAKKGLPVSLALVGSSLVGCWVAYVWFTTSHWLGNNALGMAFCIAGFSTINLGSIKNSTLVLVGLFVYDIFMVFGTGYLLGPNKVSVMEEVATKVEGPIKLLFPLPAQDARGRTIPFSMLGLGDIIVPGLHLALLQRFDASLLGGRAGEGEAPTPYFNAGLLAYALGIISTNISMNFMNTAQPALLFLVPFVLGLPYLLALGNGHAAQLWNWKEEGGEEVDFSLSGLVSSLLGETVSGLLGLEVKKKGD